MLLQDIEVIENMADKNTCDGNCTLLAPYEPCLRCSDQ